MNHAIKYLILLFLFSVVLGCSGQITRPDGSMSTQESAKVTTKHFQALSANELLNTAEQLFQLADPKDFIFHRTHDRLVAWRNNVTETEQWDVWASEQNGVVTLTLMSQIERTDGFFTPITYKHFANGPEPYQLFWARLDYLLGKSNTWTRCEEMEYRVVWPDPLLLCHVAEDRQPTREQLTVIP